MKLSEIKITPILDSIKMLNISDKEYFGKNYSNYISNSRLNLLKEEYNGSPSKFFEGLALNTQYSDSLLFGSAIHELVLQPESFVIAPEINRPTAKAGMMADELYRSDGKVPTYDAIKKASEKLDYYKSSMNSDKADTLKSKCKEYWRLRADFENNYKDSKEIIYLSDRDREKLNFCLESLEKDNEIIGQLHAENKTETGFERTFLLDVKVEAPENKPFILKLKGKLDNFIIDKENNCIIVNDLKTTGRPVSEFENAINRFSYYREMAMYSYLLCLYAKEKYDMQAPIIKSNFLVVETIPKYSTQVFPMTKKLFKEGLKEFTKLLKLAAFYCCDGNGYEEFRSPEFIDLVAKELNEGSGENESPNIQGIKQPL